MTEAKLAFASPTGKGDLHSAGTNFLYLRSRGKGKVTLKDLASSSTHFYQPEGNPHLRRGRNPMELTVVQTAHLHRPRAMPCTQGPG